MNRDDLLIEAHELASIIDDPNLRLFDASVVLNPAYPNPFNPQTTISFSIPDDNSIKLSVYDSMGRVVTDIASGLYQAGYYEFEWDAAEFSSGIYFVKMDINGSIHMQKIMLLK